MSIFMFKFETGFRVQGPQYLQRPRFLVLVPLFRSLNTFHYHDGWNVKSEGGFQIKYVIHIPQIIYIEKKKKIFETHKNFIARLV